MTTKAQLLKRIRQNCSECMGGPRTCEDVWPVANPADIESCTAVDCGLYLFRQGRDPEKNRKRQLQAKRNFGHLPQQDRENIV